MDMSGLDRLAPLFDMLCPMHVALDDAGRIVSAGPTMKKLLGDGEVRGLAFLDIFQLDRPRTVRSVSELMESPRTRLHLTFHRPPRTRLKGVMVPLPDGQGAIVDLSFGISLLDAVNDYALTAQDFAPTSLAVELLYLVEAKTAAMESLHNLNRRLDDQKKVAEEQAATDVLTGLWNRRAFDERLARLSAGVRPFALMHLDLDRFKRVNDTLGHAAGDHVLKHVGQIMSEEIRGRDSVARVGGDEFMIILEGVTDGRELSAIARRLIERISSPMPYKDRDFVVSASIGIVIANLEEALSPESLFGRADLALYAAKSAGRADHRFYDSALERQFERRLDGTEPARRA